MKTILADDGSVTMTSDGFEDTDWRRETVWSHQVGGNHYAKYAIQPTTYIIRNALGFCEGNVIKYVTRWKDKGGVEDLKKARHYIDMLIEETEK